MHIMIRPFPVGVGDFVTQNYVLKDAPASVVDVSFHAETNNSVRTLCQHMDDSDIVSDASVPLVSVPVHSPIIVKSSLLLIHDHNICLDWVPNHLLVLHTLLLFSILNPFVLPFGALYFLIQTGKAHASWKSKSIICYAQVLSKIRS